MANYKNFNDQYQQIGHANLFGSLCVAKDEVFKPIDQHDLTAPYWISSNGQVYSAMGGLSLRQDIRDGYSYVTLPTKQGIKDFLVHRLVAHYFLQNPNPEILTQVDHLDGWKINNRADNLEWVSPTENARRYRERLKEDTTQ